MKEDLGNLKHEWVPSIESGGYEYSHIYRIQMELDTRKNESKAQLKQQTIAIEVWVSLILPLHRLVTLLNRKSSIRRSLR